MDATTMPSTPSLLEQILRDHPQITFTVHDDFEWSPSSRTIFYDPNDSLWEARLLHELGHAELSHTSYNRDIELIAHERDAWQQAKTILAPHYNITIDADTIEHDMDTYRDWMHARSTCPKCSATGLQTKDQEYTCVVCRNTWRVNEARTCQLRRYQTK